MSVNEVLMNCYGKPQNYVGYNRHRNPHNIL